MPYIKSVFGGLTKIRNASEIGINASNGAVQSVNEQIVSARCTNIL